MTQEKLVTPAELAELDDLDRKMVVRHLAAADIKPARTKGRVRYYEVTIARRALRGARSLSEIQDALMCAKASLTELKRRQRAGEFVTEAHVETTVRARMAAAAALLQMIPGRYASDVAAIACGFEGEDRRAAIEAALVPTLNVARNAMRGNAP